MIGSFWNLCRACPSMPVDKLHSEYRSTYRWHEYTGGHQEVVRRSPAPAPPGTVPAAVNAVTAPSVPAPEPVTTGPVPHLHQITATNTSSASQALALSLAPTLPEPHANVEGSAQEPAMPRRKKHPQLAYRTHYDIVQGPKKAFGPGPGHPAPVHADRRMSKKTVAAGLPSEKSSAGVLFRQAISRISTEYRLQFAWPAKTPAGVAAAGAGGATTPRKSFSMGAIRNAHASFSQAQRRTAAETKDANNCELEPLVNDQNDSVAEDDSESHKISEDKQLIRKDFKTEYKKKFRPFSQYEYLESEGRFTRRASVKRDGLNAANDSGSDENDGLSLVSSSAEPWYKEVIEMRKKAGEYKHRGWGTVLAPDHLSDLYNKQIELWDQVSRRSSLSALSLAAASHRSITKEEKEKENNIKISPTRASARKFPGTVKAVNDNRSSDNSARSRRDGVPRHHFDRTTGAEDGVILTSPTREKLEPVIPKKRDEDKPGSQKSSPQKSSPQKSSPQKSSPQKSSPQKSSPQKSKKGAPHAGRSQSVGPVAHVDNRSPKRQPRSATSTRPQQNKSIAGADKTPAPTSATDTSRRPRPTDENSTRDGINDGEPSIEQPPAPVTAIPDPRDLQSVVKSPPEPTRVKSPEQILMRSPDPVNWTVPLDTGKTFTVTQNVHEGDLMNRPHSEVKAWTPPDAPPPAPQSAPPELPQQSAIAKACKRTERRPAGKDAMSAADPDAGRTQEETSSASSTSPNPPAEPPESVARSASTLSPATRPVQSPYRVLEAPEIEPSTTENPLTSPSAGSRSLASEVLEKARTRFDKFWAKNSKDGN